MDVSPELLELIARTYDSVLSPQAWPEVLEGFVGVVDARAANLFVSDRSHPEVQVSAASKAIPAAFVEAYQSRYAQHDAPAVARLMTYPAQELVRDLDLLGGRIDPAFSEWLQTSVGIYGRVSARLNDHRAWVDGLTINLGEPYRKGLTAAQRRTCGILLPHFAKAVEVSRPFHILKARFHATVAALDRFHTGVMLLNENGQVVVKNREAERILGEKDGLVIDRAGRPSTGMPGSEDGAKLEAAITQAIATAHARGLERETLLTIRRPSGADPLVVEVSPLHGGDAELQGGFRGALLLTIDPDRVDVVSTRGIGQLYDLTPAESEVLGLLVEGRPTSDIADERGTSPETVRTQVKAIFSKTGAQTRSALVRLALKVNIPIDPPTGATPA